MDIITLKSRFICTAAIEVDISYRHNVSAIEVSGWGGVHLSYFVTAT